MHSSTVFKFSLYYAGRPQALNYECACWPWIDRDAIVHTIRKVSQRRDCQRGGSKLNSANKPLLKMPDASVVRNSEVLLLQHRARLPSYGSSLPEGCPHHHNQVHKPHKLVRQSQDALSLYIPNSQVDSTPIIVKGVAPSNNNTAKSTNRMADNTKAMLAPVAGPRHISTIAKITTWKADMVRMT